MPRRSASESVPLARAAAALLSLVALASCYLTARRAQALGFNDVASEDDLASTVQEMPRLDIGTLQVDVHPNLLSKISVKAANRHAERSLGRQIGPKVAEAFSSFGSLLNAWTRRTLAEIQLRFESHADGYRAHLERIKASGHLSGAEAEALEQDLQMLVDCVAARISCPARFQTDRSGLVPLLV